MTIKRRKFQLGIRLKPTDQPTVDNGDLSVSTDDTLKVRLDGVEETVLTAAQSQQVSNKIVDTTNTVQYDDLNQPIRSLGSDLQTALDNVKLALEAQNEADEIGFTPVAPLVSTDVQAAIVEVQSNLTAHIDDTVDAHDASAISYVNTSSGLAATQVQAAIDELDGRIDTAVGNAGTLTTRVDNLTTLSGVAANSTTLGTFTGVTIPDNQNVKQALQSLETAHEATDLDLDNHVAASTDVHGVGVGNAVVGTGTTQTLTNKTLTSPLLGGDVYHELSVDSVLTGSGAVLNPTTSVVKLTNTSLSSITGIFEKESGNFGAKLVIINSTGSAITILNEVGATAARRIVTGTGADLVLADDASVTLLYDRVSDRWRTVGGSGGSGGSSANTVISVIAGGPINAFQAVYVDTAGELRQTPALDTITLDTVDNYFIGIAKQNGGTGDLIEVVTSGELDGFTGLNPGVKYFKDQGASGTISDNPPEDGIILQVGVAISDTKLVVNGDVGSSAKFVSRTERVHNIANNVNTPTTIQTVIGSIPFSLSAERSVTVEYTIRRATSLTELVEAGKFTVLRKASGYFITAHSRGGDESGVEFTVNGSGIVQYTSSNITGTGYTGTFRYTITSKHF